MFKIGATSIATATLAVFVATAAPAETMMKSDAAPFLYTIVADAGEISQAGENGYFLTLNKTA
ncbi:MAG: hypothetical protein GY788_29590, partial [bacterium]|nr:hypothetical protein [bacterium]